MKKSMSDEEIKKLAEDMYMGKVFTDRDVANVNDLGMVFMPILFLDEKQIEELQEDLGMIYEYMDKAGPRSVNGMPIFVSFKTANREDTKKVLEKCNQIIDTVAKI